MAQWKRASFRVDAGTSGFIYISDSDRTVPAELGKESQAFSCLEERNSACRSSSSRDDRTLVDLCLESSCFSVLCMGISVNLRLPIYHPSLSPLVTISLSKHYFKTLVQCDRDVRFQRDCGCKTTLKLKQYYADVRGHF